MKIPYNCYLTLNFKTDNLEITSKVCYKTFAENEAEACDVAEAAIEFMPTKFADIVASNSYKINDVRPSIESVTASVVVPFCDDFDITEIRLKADNE